MFLWVFTEVQEMLSGDWNEKGLRGKGEEDQGTLMKWWDVFEYDK